VSIGIIVTAIVIIYMIAILCMAMWMDEQTYRTPHIPETESEARCRHLKLRIKQAEWEAERRKA
tara:strand:+ start:377 stop:568 length:192 start_codon:yes stop_codon:yes gene_type:complete